MDTPRIRRPRRVLWKLVHCDRERVFLAHLPHGIAQERLDTLNRLDTSIVAVPMNYNWNGRGWSDPT